MGRGPTTPKQMSVSRPDTRDPERPISLEHVAGELAHEINNALTSMRLSLGRLVSFEMSRRPLSSEGQHRVELLQDVREGVARIERVVRELKSISPVDEGALTVVDAVTAEPAPVASCVVVSRRVLIIDDDRPVAAAIALELSMHDVVVADSGRGALEVLRRDSDFDVIFCDLMMPEVTGMDVYQALRTIAPSLLERVVLMTGGAFTPQAQRFLREVNARVIEKPFELGQLQALVETAVPGARPAAP